MSTDGEHVRPFAVATDRPSSDEEYSRPWSSPRKPRRRRCLICCLTCSSLVVVLAVVLIILAFTVYKVREPTMTMNSISLQQLSVKAGSTLAAPLAVNMTVTADVSVKNPNAASFKFGRSTTSLYYREGLVAVVLGPPGTAAAHRTFRLNVTVDVLADRLMNEPSLATDIGSGEIDLTTSTKVGGRVKILGIFKHHVDVVMNCSMTVGVVSQKIMNQTCHQRVWL